MKSGEFPRKSFSSRLYNKVSRRALLAASMSLAIPWMGYAAGAKPALITREEVLESLKVHGTQWAEKIRETSPRLYFSGKAWPQVEKEIADMQPPRAAIVPAFFADMDRIVAEPLPVYYPPGEMVGKRGDTKTLYSAMEELWQREIGDQIFALSVAARLKPDPRYKTKLHDLVMAAVGFETWGRNKPPMGNNCDLAAGHVGRGIAVAYDWHRNLFTDAEREQIRKVVTERMSSLLGGLYGNAFWARGYQENHNQVSVAALGFCGIAFYDDIPEAPEWLAASRLDFMKVGEAASADGSSVEGVSYWNYGLQFILQYIEATRLILESEDMYELPFLKNAAAYRLMAATPGLIGNLPWGDAVTKDWTYPHQILYRLAAEYRDADAAWFADHLPAAKGDALNLLWARNAPQAGAGPKSLDGRLWVNDLATSRTGWEQSDYLLSIKAGFTNRNHSHLDSGAIAIAFGNEWVLVAPGYGKGASEGAFWQSGGTRWNYFSNSTESHSTLLINGKNQRFDHDARSSISGFFSSPAWTTTMVDLSGVYQDVRNVSREVIHRRGEYILVFDSVSADKPVLVEWLAQMRNEPVWNKDGSLTARGANGRIQLDMLAPVSGFYLRNPGSPKVDVKPAGHFTCAADETGTEVRFVALIQPIRSVVPVKQPAKASMENGGGPGSRLKISGDGWTDRVVKTEKPGELRTPLAQAGKDAIITGRISIIREIDDKVTGILALDATSARLPGLSYQSDAPCDLSIELASDGTWAVTASSDVSGKLTSLDGRKIRFLPMLQAGKQGSR